MTAFDPPNQRSLASFRHMALAPPALVIHLPAQEPSSKAEATRVAELALSVAGVYRLILPIEPASGKRAWAEVDPPDRTRAF